VTTPLTFEDAAKVVHEAMRAYRAVLGQPPLPPWEEAEAWMKTSTVEGVAHSLNHPDTPPSRQHEQWLEEKTRTGWKYGPERDDANKIHPLMVPYALLPEAERRKDALITAVTQALLGPIG
jgi:hypothetical protein